MTQKKRKNCGCKHDNSVYCIINPATNKLHRVTFSLHLAEHIIGHHFPNYTIITATAIRGKKLTVGEESAGIYGIVGTKKDILLRCPLMKEQAEIYSCCDSRHIEEIFLQF